MDIDQLLVHGTAVVGLVAVIALILAGAFLSFEDVVGHEPMDGIDGR